MVCCESTCMQQSAAKSGCWQQEGFLGQVADGRKCSLSSASEQLQTEFLILVLEHWQFLAASDFLLPYSQNMGPHILSHASNILRALLCSGLPSLLPSIVLTALVQTSGL